MMQNSNNSDKTKSVHSLKCHDVQALLSAYVDDELSFRMRLRISNHVAECTDCRLLLEDMQAITMMAKELGLKAIPEDVSSRLRQVLASRCAQYSK